MGKKMGTKGDFNDIVTQEDKQGGILRMESSFKPFRDFIREMEMGEMNFSGRRWTWANNRVGEGFIEERLDMFFGYAKWLLDFDKAVVKHILTQSSDHSIVILDTENQQHKRKTRFIFYNRWSKQQTYAGMIQEGWNANIEGSRMFRLHKKVKKCREKILE